LDSIAADQRAFEAAYINDDATDAADDETPTSDHGNENTRPPE
jgi:hypothetical protein